MASICPVRQRLAGFALVLVAVSSSAQPYIPGQTYFGRSNYIEYIAGDMPFILSAPHGGAIKPAELPNRTTNAPYTNSVFTTDANTTNLANEVRKAMTNRFGHQPHVIICHLDRDKIDCNREIGEGAQGNVLTEISWNDFQNFISAARQTVSNQFGKGFYIDLHGHGHTNQQLEIGYLLTSSELNHTDNTLNTSNYAAQTSIRELDQRSPSTFAQLLRGTDSLGGLMAGRGFPSVPSPTKPDPDGDPYFNGGYNTLVHGSISNGTISSLQIECNFTNVRDSAVNRTMFATNLAGALDTYFSNHFAMNLHDGRPTISSLANQTTDEDTAAGPFAFTVGDSETPADLLTLGRSSSNTNLLPVTNIVFSGSGNNRMVTLLPATNQSGTAAITLSVTDTNGGMASTTFTLTVNPVNDPPVLAAITDRTNNAGVWLLITNTATDIDVPAQALTFSLLMFPSNATIGASSGVFSWRPAVAQADSTNLITVQVADNGMPPLAATQSFTVVVNLLPDPSAGMPALLADGQLQLTITGEAGPDYTVQATTDLTNWTDLLITNPPVLPFNWTDTNAGSFLQRFYRVMLGP
jgi:hypothetical protein